MAQPTQRLPPLESLLSVGVLRSTLLPNLQFHTALAVPAYLLARATDKVEIKDHLWFTGQLLNAWYVAIGKRVINEGLSLGQAIDGVSRPGWIVLSGVTLWSLRSWYRMISRRLRSDRVDDARYDSLHADPSSWNSTIPLQFAMEAVIQSLITLPFTAAFRYIPAVGVRSDLVPITTAAAIGLWWAGFTLETLADAQLASHQKAGEEGLMRSGVWSIVRHPNYLGDAMIHLSYPLFLFSQSLFNPLTLLGPLTNWFFLRYISGDRQTEAHQEEEYNRENPRRRVELAEYRDEKNAFWPAVSELGNLWSWAIIGSGVAGVYVTRYASGFIASWARRV